MAPRELTDRDWEEIYYALGRKAAEIEAGVLDDEVGEVGRRGSDTSRWASHLRAESVLVAPRWRGPPACGEDEVGCTALPARRGGLG